MLWTYLKWRISVLTVDPLQAADQPQQFWFQRRSWTRLSTITSLTYTTSLTTTRLSTITKLSTITRLSTINRLSTVTRLATTTSLATISIVVINIWTTKWGIQHGTQRASWSKRMSQSERLPNMKIDDVFTESGYTDWKNATDTKKGFSQHEKSEVHCSCSQSFCRGT